MHSCSMQCEASKYQMLLGGNFETSEELKCITCCSCDALLASPKVGTKEYSTAFTFSTTVVSQARPMKLWQANCHAKLTVWELLEFVLLV